MPSESDEATVWGAQIVRRSLLYSAHLAADMTPHIPSQECSTISKVLLRTFNNPFQPRVIPSATLNSHHSLSDYIRCRQRQRPAEERPALWIWITRIELGCHIDDAIRSEHLRYPVGGACIASPQECTETSKEFFKAISRCQWSELDNVGRERVPIDPLDASSRLCMK